MTSRATTNSFRRMGAAVAALLAASMLVLASPAAGQGGEVGDWLSRINGLRASRGLAPLQLDGQLSSLAAGWSQKMASEGRLSHTPDLSAGVTANWTKLGENVGFGPNSDVIMNAFINSSAHYANLTDPAFTHVGIGVAYSGGQQFVTHRFMGVAGGSAPAPTPPPAPTPAPAPAPSASAPRLPAAPSVDLAAIASAFDAAAARDAAAAAAAAAAATPAVTPPPAEPGRVAAVLDALRDANG